MAASSVVHTEANEPGLPDQPRHLHDHVPHRLLPREAPLHRLQHHVLDCDEHAVLLLLWQLCSVEL